MKKRNLIYPVIVMGFALIITSSCNGDDPVKPTNPTNGLTTAIFNPTKKYGAVYDVDGNEYKTIQIGAQTWMAENLRTTRYRNGDAIPNITDNAEWATFKTGAYCNYNNTGNLDTIATLGRLYNWYAAADKRNIAPKGWHVPIDAEWAILISYLGVDSIASVKLKEAGNKHWLIPLYHQKSTNESGFTALPGGERDYYDGTFWNFLGGGYGLWWSSDAPDEGNAYSSVLAYYNPNYIRNSAAKTSGASIRCLKDN